MPDALTSTTKIKFDWGNFFFFLGGGLVSCSPADNSHGCLIFSKHELDYLTKSRNH